jgi:hypothetical protein
MRKRRLTMLLFFFSALAASGQSCYHFSNGMSTYQTSTYDPGGVCTKLPNGMVGCTVPTVHALVYVDGMDPMTATYPCVIPNGTRHTASSSITLTSNTGAQKTGYNSQYGSYNDYLSETTEAILPVGTDTSWNFQWGASLQCSSAGFLWLPSGNIYLSIAETFGKLDYGSVPSCHYKQNCTNTTTPRCGANGWINYEPFADFCEPYVFTDFLAIGVGQTYNCYGIDTLYEEPGGGECTPH